MSPKETETRFSDSPSASYFSIAGVRGELRRRDAPLISRSPSISAAVSFSTPPIFSTAAV
jgi:hypothetical protein